MPSIVIDILIILFILIFVVTEWKNGVLKAAFSVGGLVIVFIISWFLKGYLGNFMCKYFPFFNFGGKLKGLSTINILLYQLLGFILIVSLLYGIYRIVLSIVNVFQKVIDKTVLLKYLSKVCGGIIGLVEGYIMAFLFILLLIIPLNKYDCFKESKIKNFILNNTPVVSKYTKKVNDCISKIYEISDGVYNNKIEKNEANLLILDTMLEYDIIDCHTAEQIVVLDKLKDVDNVERVINKCKYGGN